MQYNVLLRGKILVLQLMSVDLNVKWLLSSLCSVLLRVPLFCVPAKLCLQEKNGFFLTCSVPGFLKFL